MNNVIEVLVTYIVYTIEQLAEYSGELLLLLVRSALNPSLRFVPDLRRSG